MRRAAILGLVASLAMPAAFAGEAPPPMLTGEVYSRQAQAVIVPMTTNWRASISTMAPEGSQVQAGDIVVEFDGTEAARQLETQEETARTEQAMTEREIAQLEKSLAQARFQFEQAQVTLDLATLKAEIPEGVLGAIEYAENQLAFEEATKALENARQAFADARKSLDDRVKQAELDERKLLVQAEWWTQMLESFQVRANQSGYVIYGIHPWTRTKFQEGDQVQTSFHVAQVADTADLAVKVWINGVDRPRVAAGDTVTIRLDALPDRAFQGRIESVSESSSNRQEWGWADYFEAEVVFDDKGVDDLLPGMSALVEVL
ncbi:HlyD family efflux transporter periplasmic adaptor subunit [Marinihelvus fidelis]|uniref:HlyD family efflux transporter periplasmic adaptor subunit n=1 Tax=Marinihelvus fidelis TaxID=2613842 RepID=A0A5N0T8Z0_9GAMM|nr:HlyD family efflux transporter periplasmic adaptor subunit [Marinihelvus fidelis]KAA9131503.1 HlyD family efflux transporter periplasmic adaptor subunit [Marinihelvus fidelis]